MFVVGSRCEPQDRERAGRAVADWEAADVNQFAGEASSRADTLPSTNGLGARDWNPVNNTSSQEPGPASQVVPRPRVQLPDSATSSLAGPPFWTGSRSR